MGRSYERIYEDTSVLAILLTVYAVAACRLHPRRYISPPQIKRVLSNRALRLPQSEGEVCHALCKFYNTKDMLKVVSHLPVSTAAPVSGPAYCDLTWQRCQGFEVNASNILATEPMTYVPLLVIPTMWRPLVASLVCSASLFDWEM
jgi:hypothetical protein